MFQWVRCIELLYYNQVKSLRKISENVGAPLYTVSSEKSQKMYIGAPLYFKLRKFSENVVCTPLYLKVACVSLL